MEACNPKVSHEHAKHVSNLESLVKNLKNVPVVAPKVVHIPHHHPHHHHPREVHVHYHPGGGEYLHPPHHSHHP